MPAYFVVQIGPIDDPVAFERYRALVPQTIAAHGGRYLVRGGPCDVLEGAWRPARLVVLEFPTTAQARAWWDSAAYAPLKALRKSCSRAEIVLIEGVPPAS